VASLSYFTSAASDSGLSRPWFPNSSTVIYIRPTLVGKPAIFYLLRAIQGYPDRGFHTHILWFTYGPRWLASLSYFTAAASDSGLSGPWFPHPSTATYSESHWVGKPVLFNSCRERFRVVPAMVSKPVCYNTLMRLPQLCWSASWEFSLTINCSSAADRYLAGSYWVWPLAGATPLMVS
jgi:hypothetical protein